jgi:hypothetical protein
MVYKCVFSSGVPGEETQENSAMVGLIGFSGFLGCDFEIL